MSPVGVRPCQVRPPTRHGRASGFILKWRSGARAWSSHPGLAVTLIVGLAAHVSGCSSPPPPAGSASVDDESKPHTYVEHRSGVAIQHVDERRDPVSGQLTSEEPEPKPVETRRLNLGKTDVEERQEDFRPIPLARKVEIVTWADEVIRGVLVSESREAYTLDVTPDGVAGPRKMRTVAREAVQTFHAFRSD